MRRVDDLDENAPSGAALIDATRGLASVGAGITPLVGEFFEQRNQALLEAEMGLGEYAYIFALSYRDRLLEEPHHELFLEGGLSPDVLELLRAALSRQFAASDAAADLRPLLERELRVLRDDPRRLPWAEQPPPVIEQSLSPFRDQLDRAYCGATAGIDMDLDSRRAMMLALD